MGHKEVAMELFLAQFVSGLSTGGIYALIVLGMNLIMLVRNVVHHGFSHTCILTMAIGWLIYQNTGMPWLAFLCMFAAGILTTVLSEPLFRPLSKRGADLETIVLAMGIGIIISELIVQFFNSGQVLSFDDDMKLFPQKFHFGAVTVSVASIIALVACVVIAIILVIFLFKSTEGRAMRAMAQNLRVAKMLGVPFGKTGVLGFGIAGLLAACIGMVCIMCLGYCNAELCDTFATKAVILMLFAGQGDIKGGILSSLLMGVVEAMALAYLPGRWAEAIFYGFIMVVIIIKPNGLFSRKVRN